MKFKLDENLGPTIQQIFLRKGYDCKTVREENLSGTTDDRLLLEAVGESRVLVTMDHDFGNVLLYPPQQTSGIVVLNPHGRTSREGLRLLVETLLVGVEQKAIRGKLWIVEPTRIREHEHEEPRAE